MKTYITSDLHFSHKSIANFCPKTRGHWATRNDPDTMDRDMIQMWNQVVNPEDTVYVLGDVAFCPAAKAVSMMRRPNFHIKYGKKLRENVKNKFDGYFYS